MYNCFPTVPNYLMYYTYSISMNVTQTDDGELIVEFDPEDDDEQQLAYELLNGEL